MAQGDYLGVNTGKLNEAIQAAVDKMGGSGTNVSQDLAGLKARMTQAESYITVFQGNFKDIDASIKKVNDSITAMEKSISDLTDSVKKLQTTVEANAKSIDTNTQAISDLTTRVEKLETPATP